MGKKKAAVDNGPMGFVLFVGWIGALVFFIGRADGFWNIIVGFLQACVWPAYVMFYVLELLVN
jgi:hypothetical protein